ncbi:enoyl-CoA hydratase/isomerase family protein [Chloroflexota bacterium]
MEFETLTVKKENGIATITLNRPDVRNALSDRMAEEIGIAFESLTADNEVRAVVFCGAGKAFCAGGDIRGLKELAEEQTALETRDGVRNKTMKALKAITTLEKPVIAMVRGPAVGAGCNLALICDLVIASEDAVFGEVFTRIGLASDWGGTYIVPRLVGMARAKDLFFTGKMIDAKEAERIGLINRVVPGEELEKTTYELAQQLAEGPTRAIGILKTQLNNGWGKDLTSVLEAEALAFGILTHSEDHKEGFEAFLEKRPPKFRGR